MHSADTSLPVARASYRSRGSERGGPMSRGSRGGSMRDRSERPAYSDYSNGNGFSGGGGSGGGGSGGGGARGESYGVREPRERDYARSVDHRRPIISLTIAPDLFCVAW